MSSDFYSTLGWLFAIPAVLSALHLMDLNPYFNINISKKRAMLTLLVFGLISGVLYALSDEMARREHQSMAEKAGAK